MGRSTADTSPSPSGRECRKGSSSRSAGGFHSAFFISTPRPVRRGEGVASLPFNSGRTGAWLGFSLSPSEGERAGGRGPYWLLGFSGRRTHWGLLSPALSLGKEGRRKKGEWLPLSRRFSFYILHSAFCISPAGGGRPHKSLAVYYQRDTNNHQRDTRRRPPDVLITTHVVHSTQPRTHSV